MNSTNATSDPNMCSSLLFVSSVVSSPEVRQLHVDVVLDRVDRRPDALGVGLARDVDSLAGMREDHRLDRVEGSEPLGALPDAHPEVAGDDHPATIVHSDHDVEARHVDRHAPSMTADSIIRNASRASAAFGNTK